MRSMGKSAVTNVQGVTMARNQDELSSSMQGICLHQGDSITIDGSSGTVYMGGMPTIAAGRDEYFQTIMQWADKYKRMQVFSTATSFEDVQQAHRIGVEGIGMCQTEFMFRKDTCIDLFRKLILSDDVGDRKECLAKMLPMHQLEFQNIFRVMNNRQVVIRLLDPPLHDFLPNPQSAHFGQEIASLSEKIQMPVDQCLQRVMQWQETNPMFGFRGCRLSIVYPEITEMQVKAIIGTTDINPFLYPDVCLDTYIYIYIY